MTKITGIIFIWQHRGHQSLRFVDVREEGWICEMRTQKARSQSKDVKHYFSTWIARSPYLQWQLQWATLLGECYWLSYCIALLVYCVCCVFVWTFFMRPCSYLVPWYVASQWDHDWVKIMWSSSHKSQKVSSPTFWRGLSITRDKKNENSSFVIDLSSALGTHKLPYCLQQPAQLAQRWHCLVISCIVKVVTRFKYTHECAV